MQILTTTVQSALVSRSRAAQPCEACGLLTSHGVIAIPNTSQTPSETFEMHLACAMSLFSDVVDIGIPFAIWHSHPMTRAMMSRADGELMQRVQLPMIVVSLSAKIPIIRCYEWGPRGPVEVANYRVTESPLQISPNVIDTHDTDRSVHTDETSV